MPNKKIAGQDILVSLNGKILAGQTDGSLDESFETIDSTDKTSGGYSTQEMGTGNWSISTDGFAVIGEEVSETHANYNELYAAFTAKQLIDITAGDAAGSYYRSGKAHIESMSTSFPKDDLLTFSASIVGYGPLSAVKPVTP